MQMSDHGGGHLWFQCGAAKTDPWDYLASQPRSLSEYQVSKALSPKDRQTAPGKQCLRLTLDLYTLHMYLYTHVHR